MNKTMTDKLRKKIPAAPGWFFILYAFLVIAVSSCITEDEYTPPGLNAPLVLTASDSVVSVDEKNVNVKNVVFQWTTGTNNGTGASIEYSLQIDKQGNEFADPVIINIGKNSREKKFGFSQLNNFFIDSLGLEPGIESNLEARILARINTTPVVENFSNVILFTAVAYKSEGPAFTQLWLVGDATPAGWSIDNPTPMIQDATDPFVFYYYGELKGTDVSGGEFKILAGATGDWCGQWFRPLTNHPDLDETSVEQNSGCDVDNKWQIVETGIYKVVINIKTSTISIEEFIPYANVYIVGDATPAGWDINNPIAMTQDPNDPMVFTWTGPLTATGEGAFKFPLEVGNWGGDFFMASSPGASITTTTIKFTPGGSPDNKFVVQPGEEGTYKITLNQLYETISIVKQ